MGLSLTPPLDSRLLENDDLTGLAAAGEGAEALLEELYEDAVG